MTFDVKKYLPSYLLCGTWLLRDLFIKRKFLIDMFELLNILLVLDYTLLNLASLLYVFIYDGLREK